MKISARTCANSQTKGDRPEPDLEFYLDDGSPAYLYLKVEDKANKVSSYNFVLRINKKTGTLNICTGLNKLFGLPLDEAGRLKVEVN